MADPPEAAAPEPLQSTGPVQFGRGVHGQYVYWITQPDLTPEISGQLQLKTPTDLDREQFRQIVVAAHATEGVEILETVCFREPHANGKPHNNLLVRARAQ